MARRSARLSTSSANPTPQKRAAPDPKTTSSGSAKRAKRDSKTTLRKTTTVKSAYFQSDSEVAPETEIEEEDEGYEDEDASAVSTPTASDDESDAVDDFSDEEAFRRRKKATPGSKTKSGAPPTAANREAWRPGVKAGLGPGKEVVIRLPKARAAGSTPYQPHTIHPNTFLFLQDLAKHNEREWLKMHNADFRAAEKDFDSFVETLTGEIIEKDSTIPELPVKDIKFRIYRDIRFSPDPTPYKPYFSAAWSRTGRKGPYAAYYLQVQPGKSFLGAGLWHPEASPLALLRRSVDRKSHKLKRVLMDPSFRREFLAGVSKDERKAVAAFLAHNSENILKTKPKGYDADNPNLDLLRLRNYTVGRRLGDDEVKSPQAIRRIADLVGILTPFVTHLNSVVMPDDDPSTDESSGGDAADDSE